MQESSTRLSYLESHIEGHVLNHYLKIPSQPGNESQPTGLQGPVGTRRLNAVLFVFLPPAWELRLAMEVDVVRGARSTFLPGTGRRSSEMPSTDPYYFNCPTDSYLHRRVGTLQERCPTDQCLIQDQESQPIAGAQRQ